MSREQNSKIYSKSRLLESESDRLQREVDEFTHKLEQQRRRNTSLETQVKSISNEVKQKKDELQAKLPSVKEERKLEIKVKNLENNLQKEMVKLNDIQSKNRELREKINVLRREKKAYVEMFDKMQQELVEKAKEAEKCKDEHLRGFAAEQKYKSKMLHLKHRAEGEIADLQQQFSEKQSVIEEDRRKQNDAMKNVASTVLGEGARGREDNVDPHLVLEKLHLKWSEACKQRKKVVDDYHRDIKVLSEAFNQIREATGIDDIDEMVTAFIKSEDQHYTLTSYVTSLNTELDSLEERYQYLTRHYEELRSLLDQEKSDSIAVASKLTAKSQELNQEHEHTLREVARLKGEIAEIQDPVEEMIREFEDCHFTLEFNRKLTRDEGFVVNEQNVEQYLGELEEYLSALITHLAHEKGDQRGAFAAVMLEDKELPGYLKEFLHRENPVEDSQVDDAQPLSEKEFKRRAEEQIAKNRTLEDLPKA